MKEENELYISALTLPKNMFNMPAQSILEKARINQLEHLKGIKINYVSASDVTILIRANAPEAFIQWEVKKKKTDKIRVVFDAAAKNKGQSLNLSLFTGPDLLNSLIGVLLRFRNNNTAIVADVEAMFHQVRLKLSDVIHYDFYGWTNPRKTQWQKYIRC